jgi:DNA polymerase-1
LTANTAPPTARTATPITGPTASSTKALTRPYARSRTSSRPLADYGIGWIEIDTAEADDVIATLVATTREQQPERRVWIMSGDRDFYQLVDECVRALNTVMKRGRRHIGPAEVVDRSGVTPAQ